VRHAADRDVGDRQLPFPRWQRQGAGDAEVPKITPDKETGLTWTVDQIVEHVGTGNTPDGDAAGSLMGEMIQGTTPGYKDPTKVDRLAIAQYLKSIPAVRNTIGQ
jgi:hypothetical protein